MLDKIGHIKNPLTVIAMFAAIAEVSGTVVLPLVAESVQGLYVWFLMFFPCFLVLLFFITLWKDHAVLYAPSDYQSDKSFIEAKFKVRFDNETALTIEAPFSADRAEQEVVQEAEVKPEPVVMAEDDAVMQEGGGAEDVSSDSEITLNQKLILKLSRGRIIRSLANRIKGSFKENVMPKEFPDITFGGVVESPDRISLVNFVDVSINARELKYDTRDAVHKALLFWGTLNSVDKERFVLHLAYLYVKNLSSETELSLEECAQSVTNLPFKTEIEAYHCTKNGLIRRSLS